MNGADITLSHIIRISLSKMLGCNEERALFQNFTDQCRIYASKLQFTPPDKKSRYLIIHCYNRIIRINLCKMLGYMMRELYSKILLINSG